MKMNTLVRVTYHASAPGHLRGDVGRIVGRDDEGAYRVKLERSGATCWFDPGEIEPLSVAPVPPVSPIGLTKPMSR